MSYRSRGLRTRRPSSVEGSPTPLPKIASYLHLAAGWRARLAWVSWCFIQWSIIQWCCPVELCVHAQAARCVLSVLSLWWP